MFLHISSTHSSHFCLSLLFSPFHPRLFIGIPTTALREIVLLRQLEHPNVVKLENVVMDPARLYLVFELVDTGTCNHIFKTLLKSINFIASLSLSSVVKKKLYKCAIEEFLVVPINNCTPLIHIIWLNYINVIRESIMLMYLIHHYCRFEEIHG